MRNKRSIVLFVSAEFGARCCWGSNAAALSWHANVVAWHKPPSEVTLNKTATALCESAGEMQGACFKDMCAIGGDATDQIATNYQTALATSVLFESIVSGLL